ncbi:MAG: ABC transporter permease [Chloroflexota bacterium]
MTRYLLQRVLAVLPVLLTVYTLTFILFQVTPGGPWDRERPAPREVVEHLNRKYGLDKPVWQQYVDYLVGVVTRFDFGPSYKRVSRTVTDIIGDFFPTSATLGIVAMALAVLTGIPLGVVSALRPNSPIDHLATFLAVFGMSIPSFIVGPILVWICALWLGWLPTSGADSWRHFILPSITLSLAPLALIARYTRSAMLDVTRADYIRTARAKGLGELIVVGRHTLRNALIPVTTVGGVITAEIIVGSFYVETVFAIPGLGRYFVTSVTDRDYPVLMGVTLLLAGIVACANLLVDVLYAALDPRIRYT